MVSSSKTIRQYYLTLIKRWGPQNWWPAQSRFEVIVGAYLTQNTAWSNVEKAIDNLRRADVLSVEGLRKISQEELEQLVRPSGYFRQKARKLKIFIRFLDAEYGGSLDSMFAQPTGKLRSELLSLNGVGPETADSILLYAGNHPVFVVDAYTSRILERHGVIQPETRYEEIQALIEKSIGSATPEALNILKRGTEPRHPVSPMSAMQRSSLAQHYNEFHALIVKTGNQFCRSTPRCESCPLQHFLKGQKPILGRATPT
ncbi:MAG TPA: endonuclease III domain-containing protein [Candidatus Angelobacter sp.]|nr:endonuclease III domain-containing protein [Candidatus Angelobacter sp.]